MVSILGLLAMCLYSTSAFIYQLKPAESKCFAETIAENSLVITEFKTEPMTQEKPLRVLVINQDKEPLYDQNNINHAKFSLTTYSAGDHAFCVENIQQEASVTVYIRVHIGADAKDFSKMASTKDLTPMDVSLQKVIEQGNQIKKEVLYLRAREEQMRHTNQTIHNRIIAFSASTIVLLLILALFQVIFLKRFFQSKKIL